MLQSIFVTYIITHHGLGGFSELINGLIVPAIGALSMLMSEPTAKSNVKRTRMFVLSLATLHCIALHCNALSYITLHYIKLHYVTLHLFCVLGKENNFDKFGHGQIQHLGEPYDYGSIMHYGPKSFSRNGRSTIVGLKTGADKMGQRDGLSANDIRQINQLYKCPNSKLD